MALLPLLLLGGGVLLLLRRKSEPQNVSFDPTGKPPVKFESKDLLTAEGLSARFAKDLAEYRALTPSFDDAQAAVARSSFDGDDDRDRAAAMTEFAATGESSAPGAATAKKLSLDFRDKFALVGKGKQADDLIAAALTFRLAAMKDGASPAARANLEKAFVQLVVDSTYVAEMTEGEVKDDMPNQAVSVLYKDMGGEGAPLVGSAFFDADYEMRSLSRPAEKIAVYVVKVDVPPSVGKYTIMFAKKV